MTQKKQDEASPDRHLIIGSSGYRGIDYVDWNTVTFPNIIDYDAVIVNVPSLQSTHYPEGFIGHMKAQLRRLISSGGDLIILADARKRIKIPIQGGAARYVYNYDWCPFHFTVIGEQGKTIADGSPRFKEYLKHLKEWSYYFRVSEKDSKFEGFLLNRYGESLAGAIQFPQKRFYGEVILLPYIPELDYQQAITLILEELLGPSLQTEAPHWIKEILVPGVDKIDEQIKETQKLQEGIIIQLEGLESQRVVLENFKKLIFTTGRELEDIFAESLKKLGGKISPAKYGEEEFILEFDGNEYLIEAKGVNKSITLRHLRQLSDYLLEYEEEKGKQAKGILFGNTWKDDPLQFRGTTDKIEFPDNVIRRARERNIALLSSKTFFSAFCAFLKNESLGKTILQQIAQTDGVVSFSLGGCS